MNVTFTLTGAFLLLGLFLTCHVWPRRPLTTWGMGFLALAGFGKIVVGFAPENINPTLHELGSVGILCGNLGLAIRRARRWLAGLSLFLGGFGLLGVLLFVGQIGGRGAAERVADYPMIVVMAVFGICFVCWWQADPDHKPLRFTPLQENTDQRPPRSFERKKEHVDG